MATKQPKMIDYLTLEDGEYQATSEDGGIHVSRQYTSGIVTVQVRADYAALIKLVAAAIRLRAALRDAGIERAYGRRVPRSAKSASASSSGRPACGWRRGRP